MTNFLNRSFFGWTLRRTNTANVIWRLSFFTGGGRPQVTLRALFQARAGTRVELPHMKESKVPGGMVSEEQLI